MVREFLVLGHHAAGTLPLADWLTEILVQIVNPTLGNYPPQLRVIQVYFDHKSRRERVQS